MSLVTDTLPALFNGVSQQSPEVRSKDQLEDLVNGWASIADGVSKRAPTEHVAKLLDSAPSNAYIHTINRDATEQYVVIVAGGVIRVFDLNGTEYTVNAPGGWDYLSGIGDYGTQVSLFTVADYTFVVNRTRECQLSPLADELARTRDYYLWLNRSYGTDENGVPYGPGYPYQYALPAGNGFLFSSVQSFDKLPDTAADGEVWLVKGDETTRFVSYYVRKNGNVWDETVFPGEEHVPNALTMPHGLVREGDNTFTFAPFSWAPRRVGDGKSNPDPGFQGRRIQKVFFYQNRLCFLYDENVIMSCVGDFGNFWRSTVLDYLDSDVIDTSPTTTKVALLQDAAAFNDGIILTSDQTQFSMTNGEAGVSAESIAIKPVTNYSVNIRAGLAELGSEVYYATEQAGWASIREYTHDSSTDALSAANITGHVPRYIPAGVHRIVPADDLNALFVLTSGANTSVYVYQFYWVSDQEKAQSAWHRWDMGAPVVSAAYLRGCLYVLMARGDGLCLEKIDLTSGAKPTQTGHQVYVDRRAVLVASSYNSASDRTVFTLPYSPEQGPYRLIVGEAWSTQEMRLLDPSTYEWIGPNQVQVPGNWTGGAFIGGTAYTFRLQFSQQYARKRDGSAVNTGRLQLRTWTVSYKDTAYFQTQVAPYGDAYGTDYADVIPSKLMSFTGRVVGDSDLILNRPSFHTGTYSFQVQGNSKQATIAIENDSHVGSTFISAEWEGFYWNRASA